MSLWWDREILAGQAFDEVIEAELDNAETVVVLWSKHSVASAVKCSRYRFFGPIMEAFQAMGRDGASNYDG